MLRNTLIKLSLNVQFLSCLLNSSAVMKLLNKREMLFFR